MRCFPFDSVNTGTEVAPVYDRESNSSDLAEWFGSFFSNGVLQNDNGAPSFLVSRGVGMSVTVAAGSALINGRFCIESTPTDISLGTVFTQGTRTDLIVLRLSLETSERRIFLHRIPGSIGSEAPYTSVSRNASVYDLVLAEVKITGAASPKIEITNLHAASSVSYGNNQSMKPCGIVTVPLQSFDIGTYYEKYATEFAEWFAQLRESLTDDTNGMAGVIAAMQDKLTALTGENADPQSIPTVASIKDSVEQLSGFVTDNMAIRKINIAQTSITTDALLPANGSWFPRQSIIPRSVANNYDAILIIFRFCANPVSGTYKLNKIGTKATDKLLDGLADYAVEIPLVIRKGETGRVVYTDRTGRVFSRTVAWLTADHSILCQGAAGKVSARWGLTSSAGSNETAVETYKNAIYIGDARYKVVSAGDLNKYAPNVKDMYIAQADPYPASGTGPDAGGSYFAHVNNSKTIKDYDQFLLPMAFYGIKAASGN